MEAVISSLFRILTTVYVLQRERFKGIQNEYMCGRAVLTPSYLIREPRLSLPPVSLVLDNETLSSMMCLAAVISLLSGTAVAQTVQINEHSQGGGTVNWREEGGGGGGDNKHWLSAVDVH